MNRVMKLLSITMLSTLLIFVGCTASKTMKDGSYKAEFEKADTHGWTEFVEITIKNEKITDVTFDAKDASGNLKSRDADYQAAMKGSDSKTWPSDFYPKLAAQLIEKQNIDDVDAVAGATTSSNNFKKLVKALEKNMTSGKTDLVKIAE